MKYPIISPIPMLTKHLWRGSTNTMRTRTAFGPRPNSASGSPETSPGDGDIKVSLKKEGVPSGYWTWPWKISYL